MYETLVPSAQLLAPIHELTRSDIAQFGGKNASLGELMNNLAGAGVRVPGGFATTADAFREHFATTGLETAIVDVLKSLDVDDVVALAKAGTQIRTMIETAPLAPALEEQVRAAYAAMESEYGAGLSVAVRSSATAEDLPDASFAGQQETYLNVRGVDEVLIAIRRVFASLYNDRAIAYRVHFGFDHSEVAMSVGVQQMVRSDLGASGVMFTLDTETGFRDAVFITSAYGLGEGVVQGAVNPDEFYVYKPALAAGRPGILKRTLGTKAMAMRFTAREGQTGPRSVTTHYEDVDMSERRRFSLTDSDVQELARLGVLIEEHYGSPMDIEWGKDGLDGQLYILQARPETVRSHGSARIERFSIDVAEDDRPEVIVTGRAIGHRIGSGVVRVLEDPSHMEHFRTGEVLVADMTDPDWEPIMKRASAIVTNRGGRTCHAAIIARELGIPAVVGTENGTELLRQGDEVTVSCADGESGTIYAGTVPYSVHTEELGDLPTPPVRLMVNVAAPEQAFAVAALPHAGVGLARLEFIINNQIGVHPRAILEPEGAPEDERARIAELSAPYADPKTFYTAKLTEGIATIAAAFAPHPVIIRLGDFKSNEYAHLIGGPRFEPDEENPMIGFRGASRYISEQFRESFALECEAIKFARDSMGLTNIEIMVPFVRTVGELRAVLDELAANGLVRGENGLRVIMMCEVPSNAILADSFLDYVDGFSIGSNDLTQLTLGLDRDSALVADVFDERDPAVVALMRLAITACVQRGKYIGICGQGPSDHPELSEMLVDAGVSSLSLNADSILSVWQRLTKV